MNHKKKDTDYAALERQHRPQIIDGLRNGRARLSYTEIRQLLGISLRQVEQSLGEAAALRAQGYSVAEIAAELGVPAGSMGRVLPGPRSTAVTARQAEVMGGLAHMHGMQIDVLAEYLNVYQSTAYAIVQPLVEDGSLLMAKVQQGRAWVYPTRQTAQQYLGWRPGDWEPPLMYARHYRAVAQARIMLVGSDPELFVSERVLRHRAGVKAKTEADARHTKPVLEFSTGREPRRGRPHVHDGWFHGAVDGQFGWWALEVELTEKAPADLDIALQGAFAAAGAAELHRLIGVLYLCRTDRVISNVEAAKARLPLELTQLQLHFAIGDFDAEWKQFADRRHAMREAKKKANRQRRTVVPISKEAS